jgi:hypothetical protein
MSHSEPTHASEPAHIELGHALITMVEPHRETVVTYNRWYEHDHFLSGVLAGPGAFAGRRFLATRALKDLRFPADSPVTRPLDDGSFITLYWIEAGQLGAHCEWGFPEAARLAGLGRMNPDRHHVSTSYHDLLSVAVRDDRPVPVELALHHHYAGLVMVWTDSPADAAAAFGAALAAPGSAVEQVVSFRPIDLPDPLPEMPGAIIGAPVPDGFVAHAAFIDAEPSSVWPDVTERIRVSVERSGVSLLLAAPFIPSVPGTDRHLDELW